MTLLSRATTMILFLASLLAGGIVCASQNETCSEECFEDPAHVPMDATRLARPHEEGQFAVVAPVGAATIERIAQAPRLETLEGKTIAVVGGSFMANVTHPEIRRLIQRHYPTAKVILLNEIGSAGPYPPPGVNRRAKDEFQKRLRELGVDAVISGNGGCGLCTPKETGSSIAAEYVGLPSVTIAAPGFVEQVYSTAVNHGVPAPRVAIYPGPFATHTREELLQNTREVLWPQLIAALTEPITEEEIEERRKAATGGIRDIVFSGTVDAINRHFTEMRWSDGLPIVPPTVERVNEFLRFTDLSWDETVGVLPIAFRDTKVWHVAVNGVMAGCPPEFMPLLIAYTRTLGDSNLRRSLASTHGWIPYCWVNGPVARQLGFDSAQGMISEPRNALLGRFVNLAILNLGGYYIKQDRMGSFGYPMSWSLAENEAACLRIGWQPYHVQLGFDLNDSTLTGASALMWGNNLTPATSDPEKTMQLMAWDAVEKSQFALGSGMPFTYRTFIVTEYIARDLASAYPTKKSLEAALVETARRPVHQRAFANYWASPGSAHDPSRHTLEQHIERIIREENGRLTDPMPWLPGSERLHTVPVMRVGMSPILVAGDPDRNKVLTLPGGGTATVKIELPENWDTLMAERGYAPLMELFLE
ncbi:MAG: hypothetical protein KF858_02525 [Candidatus Sumerlaeia bacterium]|nr:hypothetical protein [Candidatus Sumerlaeia bacterium]